MESSNSDNFSQSVRKKKGTTAFQVQDKMENLILIGLINDKQLLYAFVTGVIKDPWEFAVSALGVIACVDCTHAHARWYAIAFAHMHDASSLRCHTCSMLRNCNHLHTCSMNLLICTHANSESPQVL